jgi:CAAX protease family protein
MPTADTASRLTSPQGGLLARHPLVFYFLIAFAFSWLMFLPAVLTSFGILNLSDSLVGVLGVTGLLGPILSGFIMTAATEWREGIGRWLRRIVRWRVGVQWYLFALIGLPVVMVLGTLIRPEALESFQTLAPLSIVPYLSAFVFMVLIGGPLFEEPGWSGFALPRLQRLHGPLVGGSYWEASGPCGIFPVLDSISGYYGYTSEGYCPRLHCVRPRSHRPPSRHHVSLQ